MKKSKGPKAPMGGAVVPFRGQARRLRDGRSVGRMGALGRSMTAGQREDFEDGRLPEELVEAGRSLFDPETIRTLEFRVHAMGVHDYTGVDAGLLQFKRRFEALLWREYWFPLRCDWLDYEAMRFVHHLRGVNLSRDEWRVFLHLGRMVAEQVGVAVFSEFGEVWSIEAPTVLIAEDGDQRFADMHGDGDNADGFTGGELPSEAEAELTAKAIGELGELSHRDWSKVDPEELFMSPAEQEEMRVALSPAELAAELAHLDRIAAARERVQVDFRRLDPARALASARANATEQMRRREQLAYRARLYRAEEPSVSEVRPPRGEAVKPVVSRPRLCMCRACVAARNAEYEPWVGSDGRAYGMDVATGELFPVETGEVEPVEAVPLSQRARPFGPRERETQAERESASAFWAKFVAEHSGTAEPKARPKVKSEPRAPCDCWQCWAARVVAEHPGEGLPVCRQRSGDWSKVRLGRMLFWSAYKATYAEAIKAKASKDEAHSAAVAAGFAASPTLRAKS